MKFEIHNDLNDSTGFHFSFDKRFSNQYAALTDSTFSLYHFSGEFSGYIPIIIRKIKFFRIAQILCFPLQENGLRFESKIEKTVLNSFVKFLKSHKLVDRITQGANWAIYNAVPDGATQCDFGTYSLSLKNQTTENLIKGFHTKHRNVIRNAEKNKVEIRSGENELVEFYRLYKDTMMRNSMSCEPLEYFKSLTQHYSSCYCAVVYSNKQAEGAIFAPYSKFGGYYVYGASAEKVNTTGAVNYLHLHFMQFLIEKGVEKYDFVGARLSDVSGTKYEGIQRFKERFGGDLEKGFLWKMDLNLPKCKLYDVALGLKTRLKGVKLGLDIIDQERMKKK